MKRKKLNLGAIEVKSFVTNIGEDTINTVKGGVSEWCLSDLDCGLSPMQTINGNGNCQWHTAIAHNCSDVVCYSNYCNSTECGGPASDVCMTV